MALGGFSRRRLLAALAMSTALPAAAIAQHDPMDISEEEVLKAARQAEELLKISNNVLDVLFAASNNGADLNDFNIRDLEAFKGDEASEEIHQDLAEAVQPDFLEYVSELASTEAVRSSTALDRQSASAKFFADRGMSLLIIKSYDEALEVFNKSIEAKPSARSHRMRAALLLRKGKNEEALSDLEECILLEPHDETHYLTRAVALQLFGDYYAAILDYNYAIEINPNAPRSWGNRGLAWMKVGDMEKAESDLDRALEIWPDYPEGLYNRGVVRHNRKDLKGAIQDYTSALQVREEWEDVIHNLKLAHRQLAEAGG